MTVVRKIFYVSRGRAVRSQKIFAVTSRMFASGKFSHLRDSKREWQLPYRQEMAWGEEW